MDAFSEFESQVSEVESILSWTLHGLSESYADEVVFSAVARHFLKPGIARSDPECFDDLVNSYRVALEDAIKDAEGVSDE